MDYQQSCVFRGTRLDATPLVLIVDDDNDNQLLLEKTIEMFGWSSIVAEDAVTTIYLAKTKQPDVVLLDIVMPEISGLQVATMLKARKVTRHIPLIAVTGLVREQEKQLIMAAGFAECISKPYHLGSIYKAIALALQPI